MKYLVTFLSLFIIILIGYGVFESLEYIFLSDMSNFKSTLLIFCILVVFGVGIFAVGLNLINMWKMRDYE